MPSWQSRVISLVIRVRIKRPQRECDVDVLLARARLGKPERGRRALIPRGMQIRGVTPPDAPVSGEWLHPRGVEMGRTVLYLHGGGYFACSSRSHRPITGALAQAASSSVFSLDYRLAPEHPYPAALDDALTAYRWLLDTGHDPSRIVIAGDSAGGGLALSAAVTIRDSGLAPPAGLVLISPWTDLAGTGKSLDANDLTCAMFHGNAVRRFARVYLGDADPCTPTASPLYADLTGLPPLVVHASDSEVLFDDSRRIVERALASGVPAKHHWFSGVPHVWQMFSLVMPEARESIQELGEFISAVTAVRSVTCRSSDASASSGIAPGGEQ